MDVLGTEKLLQILLCGANLDDCEEDCDTRRDDCECSKSREKGCKWTSYDKSCGMEQNKNSQDDYECYSQINCKKLQMDMLVTKKLLLIVSNLIVRFLPISISFLNHFFNI